jgi:hypothetical protein
VRTGKVKAVRIRDRNATEPRGVRIRHTDGSVSECSLVRDPDDDRKGNAQWIAIPEPGTVLRNGDSLSVDVLPGRTVVTFRP